MNTLKELLAYSGCSRKDCLAAIEYAAEHPGCTPLGYLKAKGIAVCTRGMTFEERVRKFSKNSEEF